MRQFIMAGLLCLVAGCKPPAQPSKLYYSYSAYKIPNDATLWHHYVVTDGLNGPPKYAVVTYGRKDLLEGDQERRTVIADGKTWTVPPEDGKLYVLDSTGAFHPLPIDLRTWWSTFQRGGQEGCYESQVWKDLYPALRQHQWPGK